MNLYVGQKINSDSKSACSATQGSYSNDDFKELPFSYFNVDLVQAHGMVSLITVQRASVYQPKSISTSFDSSNY